MTYRTGGTDNTRSRSALILAGIAVVAAFAIAIVYWTPWQPSEPAAPESRAPQASQMPYPKELPSPEEAERRMASERDTLNAELEEAGISDEEREQIETILDSRPDTLDPEEVDEWYNEASGALPDNDAVMDAFQDFAIAFVISVMTQNPAPVVRAFLDLAYQIVVCGILDACGGGGGGGDGNGENTGRVRADDEGRGVGPQRPEKLPVHPDNGVPDGVSFRLANNADGAYLLMYDGEVASLFAELGSCAEQLDGAQVVSYEEATRKDDYTTLTFFKQGETRALLVEYVDRGDNLSPESFDVPRAVRIGSLDAGEEPGAADELHACTF